MSARVMAVPIPRSQGDSEADPAQPQSVKGFLERQGALLGVSAIVAAAVLVPLPILRLPGWPQNDESLFAFDRVEAFRRSFRIGVWYPLWTPFAHSGFGSPYPLFYHRLYSTLAALASFAIGSVPLTVKLSVVIILLAGGLGMRRLLRVSGADEGLAAAGALLFVVAPYTRTDWLVRGAMAESTALALLPWLYAEGALFMQGRRRWIVLACGIVLLFHAHAMICYFFLLSAAGLLLASTLGPRRQVVWGGASREWRSIAVALAILAAGVLPNVIVASAMMKYFNTAIMTHWPWRLRDNYAPFSRYLADAWPEHRGDFGALSLEVNRYVLAGLVACYLVLGSAERWKWQWRVPLFGFFLVWTLVCFLLQLPAFRMVLMVLPNGRYLQFPWRLNSFSTIGTIFLLVTAVRSVVATAGRELRVGTLVGLAAVVVLSIGHFGVIPVPADPPWTAEDVAQDVAHLDGPLGAGEYLLPGMEKTQLLYVHRRFVETDGCSDRVRTEESLDKGEFRMSADLDAPCRITLRQFQTPLLKLDLDNAWLLSTEPSQEFAIELQPGASSVRLRPRSLGEMLFAVMRGKLSSGT